MTSRAEWDKILAAYESAPQDTKTSMCLGAVLELHDQVMGLGVRLEDLARESDRRELLEVRAAAIAEARRIVSELPSEQPNPRGFRDHAMRPAERIEAELRVARFLLREDR